MYALYGCTSIVVELIIFLVIYLETLQVFVFSALILHG